MPRQHDQRHTYTQTTRLWSHTHTHKGWPMEQEQHHPESHKNCATSSLRIFVWFMCASWKLVLQSCFCACDCYGSNSIAIFSWFSRNLSWRKKEQIHNKSVETAPRNCRFLLFVDWLVCALPGGQRKHWRWPRCSMASLWLRKPPPATETARNFPEKYIKNKPWFAKHPKIPDHTPAILDGGNCALVKAF